MESDIYFDVTLLLSSTLQEEGSVDVVAVMEGYIKKVIIKYISIYSRGCSVHSVSLNVKENYMILTSVLFSCSLSFIQALHADKWTKTQEK